MHEGRLAHSALKSAVSIYRQPLLARGLVRKSLPDGISDVLRVAAEGVGTAAQFADSLGASPEEVHQACLFYLQTVVFHQNADDTRLLALSHPLTAQELREHKRMILKWLHPDRNHNSWESKLFLRVQSAVVRLEQLLKDESFIPVAPIRPSVSSHRLQHNLETKLQRKITSGGMLLQVLNGRMLSIFFAMIVIVLGIFSVLAIAYDKHDFGFSYEATN